MASKAPKTPARRVGKASIRRAVASSTAIETEHSVKELENKLKKNECKHEAVQLAKAKPA